MDGMTPLALAIVLCRFQGATVPPVPDPAKVLAKVNGSAITAADLESYLWDWRSGEVLQDLISLKSVEAVAALEGVSATDAEVTARMDKEMAQFGANASALQRLRDQGFPPSRIRLRIESEVLLEKIILKDFKPEEWVRVSSIAVVPPNQMTLSWGSAIKKTETAYARLKNGVGWDRVSADFGTGAMASQWQQLEALPAGLGPVILAAAKTMPANSILPPRQVAQGVRIFRVEMWGGKVSPADLETLQTQFINQNRDAALAKVRSEAKVDRTP